MEEVDISLSRFSFSQKLYLMESLWADLTKDEKEFKSPAWHKSILKDREKALKAGKVTVTDWDVAKRRIKRNVS
jgi:hypothetical protein